MGGRIMGAPTGLVAAACASVLVGCAAGPDGASELPRWSVVEELRIGSVDDPTKLISTVSALAVDDDGRMYLAQPDDGTVRVFDGAGILVDFIGRRGPGPGEFQRLYTLGLLADTLYTIDFGHHRIDYFSLDGELLRSDDVPPPPVGPPLTPAMPFAVFPDGSRAIGTAFASNTSPEELRRVPQLRTDRTGLVLDTVGWISYERSARRAIYEGRPLAVGSPFSDDAFVLFSDDGAKVAAVDRTVAAGPDEASFGITLTDRAGDTVFSRRYDYVPTTIPTAVVDTTVADRAEIFAAAFPDPREAHNFVRNTMFLPVYYPPVTTVSFSDTGELWVGREEIRGEQQRWLILDEAGEPVAETRTPEGVRVMHIGTDRVWGVELDERAVPYLVRYRIDR